MKTYNVGIVGAGFGVRSHLPAYRAHSRFEVVALASPSSAARVAGEQSIPFAFKDADEMLAGCDLDVISIAAPPFTHHHDVMAALHARKHVVCEKPFALSVAQAQEMRDAARTAGTATAVMHEFRWLPARQALKELILNGHIAPLRDIEVTHLFGSLRREVQRRNTWWFDPERGGGMAGALLSHNIDTANWLAGCKPVRSTGFRRTANPQRVDANGPFLSKVDDGAFALIDYGDGIVARATVDATTSVESLVVAAHGENRTAVASGKDLSSATLYSVDADETAELECKPSPNARFVSVDPNAPLIMDLLDEFVKQIETGHSEVPTFDDAVETQKVLASVGFGS